MKTSDSIKAISAALVAAHAGLEGVPKDATNPHFKNTYASLGAVIDASKPSLLAHGIVVLQGLGEVVGNVLQVTTRLLHGPSGEWIESTMGVPMSKVDAQGAGSAATYGRRYGLAAMLSLAQVDDDGEEASKPAPKPTSKQKDAGAPTVRPDHHALGKFMAENRIPRETFARICSTGLKLGADTKVTDLNPAQVATVTRLLQQEMEPGDLESAVEGES